MRMLGTGRPFAIECCNPKKAKFTSDELSKLEVEFNKLNLDVSINDLKVFLSDLCTYTLY